MILVDIIILLQLMFQVSDGSLTGNTSVIVDVIDENDNAPTFNNVE